MTVELDTSIEAEPWALAVVSVDDVRAQPLFDDLRVEYSARYPGHPVDAELARFPASEFQSPHGAFLIVQCSDRTVAGGAFRRYDETTAELKRIWTEKTYRQRGLGQLVVAELECIAVQLGYQRAYLTTGPRQPEARALYLTAGYEPLFDLSANPEELGHLAFSKRLSRNVRASTETAPAVAS